MLANGKGCVALARHGDVPVAGAVFLHFSQGALFKFGASDEAFQHLRFKGHDLVAFHVLDQNELDFDFTDPVLLLEDAETQEQMPVLPGVVMDGYRERMRQHVEELAG